MNKVAIITGGSKGIGKALSEIFRKKDFAVFSISRSKVETNDSGLIPFQFDVSDLENLPKLMEDVFSKIDLSNLSEIVLINNAGILGHVASAHNMDHKEIRASYEVNVMAPAILSSLFIKKLESASINKSIINISSGAAVSPIKGWSTYCSTKAALDMLTRTIALEQEESENRVRVIAIYPGIVDTDMQVKIRSTKKEHFADVDRFIKFKEDGDLLSAEVSAQKIIDLWMDPEVVNGTVRRIE